MGTIGNYKGDEIGFDPRRGVAVDARLRRRRIRGAAGSTPTSRTSSPTTCRSSPAKATTCAIEYEEVTDEARAYPLVVLRDARRAGAGLGLTLWLWLQGLRAVADGADPLALRAAREGGKDGWQWGLATALQQGAGGLTSWARCSSASPTSRSSSADRAAMRAVELPSSAPKPRGPRRGYTGRAARKRFPPPASRRAERRRRWMRSRPLGNVEEILGIAASVSLLPAGGSTSSCWPPGIAGRKPESRWPLEHWPVCRCWPIRGHGHNAALARSASSSPTRSRGSIGGGMSPHAGERLMGGKSALLALTIVDPGDPATQVIAASCFGGAAQSWRTAARQARGRWSMPARSR